MSNMNFLIADVTYFVSGTMITFSPGGATKIKFKQFSEFGSRTNTPISKDRHEYYLPVSFLLVYLVCMTLVCKLLQNEVSNL